MLQSGVAREMVHRNEDVVYGTSIKSHPDLLSRLCTSVVTRMASATAHWYLLYEWSHTQVGRCQLRSFTHRYKMHISSPAAELTQRASDFNIYVSVKTLTTVWHLLYIELLATTHLLRHWPSYCGSFRATHMFRLNYEQSYYHFKANLCTMIIKRDFHIWMQSSRRRTTLVSTSGGYGADFLHQASYVSGAGIHGTRCREIRCHTVREATNSQGWKHDVENCRVYRTG